MNDASPYRRKKKRKPEQNKAAMIIKIDAVLINSTDIFMMKRYNKSHKLKFGYSRQTAGLGAY